MNIKGIIFFLGIYTLFIGFFSVLNILYSIYLNFVLDINSYFITFIVCLIIGIVFFAYGKSSAKSISINEQILLILLGYIFLPLLISLPYFFSVYNLSFLNSYFESISGFTTTGFSIIINIQSINEPLILWRSSSQWLGGLFFLFAIISTLGLRSTKIKPVYLISNVNSANRFHTFLNLNFFKILIIYFLSTIMIVLLYKLTDIRFFDSLNLAFTTVSTGGFLSRNSLNSIILNDLQELILSATLIIPLLNFYLFYKLFFKEFKFREHYEDFHLLFLVLFFTVFFYFFLLNNEGIIKVFLMVMSSISTSGISIYSSNVDISLLFLLLTIIGGSVLSTSSGLKYIRLYILFKISYKEIYKLVKPNNIFNTNLFKSETIIDNEDINISFFVFISFLISLFVLSILLTLDLLTFEDSFKLSILTLTNTVSSSLYGLDKLSFFDLNILSKMSLIVFMIIGKIEIIAILFLTRKYIFKE